MNATPRVTLMLRRCRVLLLRRYVGALVCLILSLHAGLVTWSAARQSPTIDEPVHIAAGVRHWQEGRRDLNRGNPPLVDLVAAIPVVLANPMIDWSRMPSSFLVAGDFGEANGSRTVWLTTIARWALLPFSLLGGLGTRLTVPQTLVGSASRSGQSEFRILWALRSKTRRY